MKLQVINNFEEAIGGFETVTAEQVFQDLSNISDNECEEIIIGDTIKVLPYDVIEKFFLILIRKLRIGGTIKLSGINLRLLILGVKNGTVTEENFNKIVSDCNSIISTNTVESLLQKYNLKIETFNNKGIVYEVEASRKN